MLTLPRSVDYREIERRFDWPIILVIMASLVFALNCNENKTSAGYGYLSLEFEVFVKIQECCDPLKLCIHQCTLFDYENNQFFPLRVFHEENEKRFYRPLPASRTNESILKKS